MPAAKLLHTRCRQGEGDLGPALHGHCSRPETASRCRGDAPAANGHSKAGDESLSEEQSPLGADQGKALRSVQGIFDTSR